jgi:hypothetical protein
LTCSTQLAALCQQFSRPVRKAAGQLMLMTLIKHCNASIYFYGVEAAVVIKLLTIYIELGDEPTADYFPELKQRRSKNAET